MAASSPCRCLCAALCQVNLDQEHLEGHHDLLCRDAQIAKDRRTCLSKVRRTRAAAKDASLAAWGEIGSTSTHLALLPASIMRTRGSGTQLAPIFGLPHRSILRGV